jgi:hypothetical protein
MVERTRLLSRAINGGERAMREVLRDLQARRAQTQNALRYRGKELRPDEAIEVRQQICEFDRLIGYTTLALSNLPQERMARTRAINDAIDIVVLHLYVLMQLYLLSTSLRMFDEELWNPAIIKADERHDYPNTSRADTSKSVAYPLIKQTRIQ